MQTAETQSVMAETNGHEPDTNDRPTAAVAAWKPRWVVDVGHGTQLGLTIDDGCFVVLYPKSGGETWKPGTHIPRAVAERISQLLPESTMR